MVLRSKYFQTVSVFLGISVPNLNHYRGLPIGYIIYWFFTLSTILSTFIYTVTTEVIYNDVDYNEKMEICKILVSTSSFILIISAMTDMVFLNRRKVVKLAMFLSSLEKHFFKKSLNGTDYKEPSLSVELFIYIFTNTLSMFVDFALGVYNFRLDNFTIFSFYIQYYHGILTVLIIQMHYYSLRIGKMFHLFNEDAKKKALSKNYSFSGLEIDMNGMMFFIRRFDDLYKAIDMVNEIYYKIIICIVLCTSLNTVCGLKIIMKLYLVERKGIYTHSFSNYFWFSVVFKNLVSHKY